MRSLFIALAFSLVATVATASTEVEVGKDEAKYTVHKVEKGETLFSLTQQYNVTLEELLAANESLSDSLKVGQKIKIPTKASVIEDAKQEEKVVPQVVAEEVKPLEQKADSVANAATQTILLENGQPATEQQPIVEPTLPPFRRLQRGERAKVVLMLPFGTVEKPNMNYVDFYRGFLMGVDSVRLAGNSVDLHLYNTARDSVRLAEIIASGELETANLVVGPVYEEELKPVLATLEGKGIPVVSPLSTHTDIKSDILFQMAPSHDSRLAKLQDLFDGSKKVLIISTNNVESKFDAAVHAMLKDSVTVVKKQFIADSQQTIAKSTNELLAVLRQGQHVVVVTSNNEYEVDRILNTLHTLKQSLAGRNGEPFIVVGNGSWARFKHIDKEVFYKCGVRVMTNYNSDRADRGLRTFERRFVRLYNSLPSLFAYRGYDASMLFIKSLYSEKMESGLEGEIFKPLCTQYEFKKNEESGVRANDVWIKQTYHKDCTITYE